MAFLTAYKEVKILSKYLVRAARRTLLLLIYRRQKQNKNYLWGWGEQKHKKRKKILSTFLSSNDSNLSFRRKQSSNFIIANCKTWFFSLYPWIITVFLSRYQLFNKAFIDNEQRNVSDMSYVSNMSNVSDMSYVSNIS
jgi:hypothetical protein